MIDTLRNNVSTFASEHNRNRVRVTPLQSAGAEYRVERSRSVHTSGYAVRFLIPYERSLVDDLESTAFPEAVQCVGQRTARDLELQLLGFLLTFGARLGNRWDTHR